MRPQALAGVVSILLGGLLAVAVPGSGARAEVPWVNLYRGEINGLVFSQMTLETLHSQFGPPSALEQHENPQGGAHAQVSYHDVGLTFWLHRASPGTALLCERVRIYLAQSVDVKAGKTFLPFTGRLSKSVDQRWLPARIETEFKTFYPQHYTRVQKEAMARHDAHLFGASLDDYSVLYIPATEFTVDFFYNTRVQLLEHLRLSVKRHTHVDNK